MNLKEQKEDVLQKQELKLQIKLQRSKEQEDSRVKFWTEDYDNGIIASLIYSSDFDNEMEIRVSTNNESFVVRGHKSIMDYMSFEAFEERVLLHLDRHESFKEMKN